MRGTVAVALACLMVATAAPASAADPAVADFSGLWARNWNFFEPPPAGVTGPLKNLSANPRVAVGDFRDPILQPWAAEVVRRNGAFEAAGGFVETAHSTCRPSGVPMVLNLRETVQLLQTPTQVTILYQRNQQVRRIYLNGKHPANVPLSWYGHSIGHYEGDTLVVDTVGLAARPYSYVDAFGTPHSDKLHVVERYRLIRDDKGEGLQVTATVTDPGAFTRPWTGIVTYRRSNGPFEEVICPENNIDIKTGKPFPIPTEERPRF